MGNFLEVIQPEKGNIRFSENHCGESIKNTKYFQCISIFCWCIGVHLTVVHDRMIHWAKNKRMIHISVSWFILMQRRECIFFLHTIWYIKVEYCMCEVLNVWMFNIYMNNPLTWNRGSLYVAGNSCPCWPYAQSQLPHFWIPCPVPIAPFFPPSHPHMQLL